MGAFTYCILRQNLPILYTSTTDNYMSIYIFSAFLMHIAPVSASLQR